MKLFRCGYGGIYGIATRRASGEDGGGQQTLGKSPFPSPPSLSFSVFLFLIGAVVAEKEESCICSLLVAL